MQRRNFLSGAVAAVSLPAMAKAEPGASGGRLEPLALGPVRALLARPRRTGGVGVILQPTIAAIDDYMTRTALSLAELGHTVLIWDPYRGERPPQDMRGQLERSRRIADDDAMHDLMACSEHLSGALGMRRVATIGWCLGGRYGLLQGGLDQRIDLVCAYNPTIYAARPVPLYGIPTSKADFPGQTLDEFALAAHIRGPVQVCRPGKDLAQPAEYQRLQEVLYARQAPTLINYFPQAEHGFAYHVATQGDRAAAAIAWPATLALIAGF